MRKELAEKLYEHLRKFPSHHFPPPKKDGSHLDFFVKPFEVTDEEGELMLQFRAYGEPIDAIAKRAGLDKNKALELLDGLTKKCWILRKGSREEGTYWINYSPVEFWMPHITSAERHQELISLYMPDPPEPGTPPPTYKPVGTGKDEDLHQLRVIPIERVLPYNSEVLPSEVVSYMIESAGDEIAVAECLCRKVKKVYGGECEKDGPLEQCLFLPPFAAAAVDAGVARKITKQEAYEIVERARKHGLFHQTYSAAHPRIICSCCPCCCQAFQMRQEQGVMDATTPSNFFSAIDPDLCAGSLECISNCPAKAIRFDKKKNTAIVDTEKCYGCGMCVEICPSHAALLKRRDKVIVVPETEDEMGRIRVKQGKGSEELFIGYPEKGQRT